MKHTKTLRISFIGGDEGFATLYQRLVHFPVGKRLHIDAAAQYQPTEEDLIYIRDRTCIQLISIFNPFDGLTRIHFTRDSGSLSVPRISYHNIQASTYAFELHSAQSLT